MYRAKSAQTFESNWKFLNEQTILFNFFKRNLSSIFIPYCPFYKLKLVISKIWLSYNMHIYASQ